MTTTDLTPYRSFDLATVGEPAEMPELSLAEVTDMLTSARQAMLQRAALVEQPTGPADLPPKPQPQPQSTGDKVNLIGSLTVLSGALTGLAFNAGISPELVIYPVGASIVAMGIAAGVHLRSLPKVPR